MDFSLNEDQEMFRGVVRKYLSDVGETKVAREFIKGDVEGSQSVYSGLADLGCTAINVPEKYGGLGLETFDLVPVLEEIGTFLIPGVYLETMALAVPLLVKFGSDAQKEKYLTEIAAGSRTVTLAWLEPKKDYNPNDVTCSAWIEEDHLIINGVKALVPDGDQADTVLLLVRTADGKDGQGLSLVLVDKEHNPEINLQKCIDETRHLTELTFNHTRIPKEQLLGELNEGWSILQEGLLYVNAGLSSLMVGGMDSVVEMASEYAKIRKQFGQPIGRFQAIKHRIADMKMDLEAARSLSYYANWALENNDEDREEAIYSARSFATEAYIRSATNNIQIHGGIGFTEEIDCHLYLKRARFYENYLGSAQRNNEQVALALGW